MATAELLMAMATIDGDGPVARRGKESRKYESSAVESRKYESLQALTLFQTRLSSQQEGEREEVYWDDMYARKHIQWARL